VPNQGRTQSRPLIFEDDPPADSRPRRAPSGASANRRGPSAIASDRLAPEDDDEDSRFGARRFNGRRTIDSPPSGPWWRPATTLGRVFLGLGVLAVASLLFTGYVVAKTYLGRDSRFRIPGAGNIEAAGLTQVNRAEILPVFGEDIGRNIFFVPLNERRKQLEAIPWVQRATVMRLLPDKIRVSIIERQPVAFVRQGQQVGLVDADGVLLTMPASTMAQHHYSFPVVTGLDAHALPSDRRWRMVVYNRMLADLDSNGQHLSQQISEIDLTDPQDARVSMPEEGKDILAHFGDDKFLDRYQRYKTHIGEWKQQYPKLTAVDLRYESQVVLEMTPGTNAVAAAVGDNGSASGINLVAANAPDKSSIKPAAGTARPAAAPAKTSRLLAEPSAKKPAVHEPALAKSETVKPAISAQAAIRPPAPSRPVAGNLVEKPAAARLTSTRPVARTTLASASRPPSAKTTATRPAVKQVSATKSKTAKKQDPVELLAAKQRAAREKARLKATHDKALYDKKHPAKKPATVNSKKPATTSATQGQ
jgi:cell division protein FtsQ